MPTIKQDDVIQSVADALQYISYYHSPDFIQAMAAAGAATRWSATKRRRNGRGHGARRTSR